MQPSPLSSFKAFALPPEGDLISIKESLPILFSSQPLATTSLFSVSMDLPILEMLYIWNHFISATLATPSFVHPQNVFFRVLPLTFSSDRLILGALTCCYDLNDHYKMVTPNLSLKTSMFLCCMDISMWIYNRRLTFNILSTEFQQTFSYSLCVD